MARVLILAGYVELMLYLQVTGKLNQFINVHYQYLATLSTVLALILALVQLYFWVKDDPAKIAKDSQHHELHQHRELEDEHDHGLHKGYQRGIAYVLLALPIIVGSLFPTVSLDTTIVEAKGFQFPSPKNQWGMTR